MNIEYYPWHQAQWQIMQEAKQINRLPHALLLAGPVGMGKLAFAESLAAAWLCAHPHANGQACGQCKSCHLLAAGTHPDLTCVVPEEAGKQIKVDRVRGLLDFMTLTPAYHQARIALIAPAENMNLSSANSVLKMLEEPPPCGRFLLVSHEPARLLATIRSRCQRLDLARGDALAIHHWLTAQDRQQTDWSLALELANFAPLRALMIAEKMPQRQQFYTSLATLILHQQDPMSCAQTWQGEEAKQIVDWMSQATMDMIRLLSGLSKLSNPDQSECLRQCAPRLSLADLFRLLDQQIATAKHLASTSNVKAQGLLTDLAITWNQLAMRGTA